LPALKNEDRLFAYEARQNMMKRIFKSHYDPEGILVLRGETVRKSLLENDTLAIESAGKTVKKEHTSPQRVLDEHSMRAMKQAHERKMKMASDQVENTKKFFMNPNNHHKGGQ
jgi:hypothetical protein